MSRHGLLLSLAGIVTTLCIFIGVGIWHWRYPLTSPITTTSTFLFKAFDEPIKTDKMVYGFLPYWNIDDVALQPELTHLSYFGLAIQANGQLQTRTDDGYLEPGYNKLSSDVMLELVDAHDGPYEITLTQFNADTISQFLTTESAQDRLIEQIDSILLAYPVSGVNVDIEYAGTVTPLLRERYVDFITKLNAFLDEKYQDINLSIDVFASAADNTMIWDLPAIAPEVDQIIIMAYDFHRRGSIQAGPVAPLFGGSDLWSQDITQYLQKFLDHVPPEKLILGVPFYGYEWQTTSRDSQAHTFPDTGSTATYKRVIDLLADTEELEVQEHWNEDALSPYLSYRENGETYVVYFENSRSLSYKLDLVNQLQLGGIAIWALGYEGEHRELWDVINRKFAE